MALSFVHNLVPRMEVMQEEEVEALLKKYKIKKEELPLIKITDPSLPENAVVGNVVKIYRNSPVTGKEELYYRLVVEESE